ncbi:carbohydrate ABC transporter permease [Microbacterium terricola]|uniref:Sugar ABC transporter permease n=1 Tax=Microbacterium terricola TaxID=344163 RepID=A0ABM8E215_9MICO|nr:carbohydrate ABC transporter permease [Microbacterium terricola]UYK40293.1 carbohydrate ABC transporter permease [Microbacterium terricola]BDV31994.1 sugar ABC transporter permease [Microbacterium terricola]
MTSSISTTMRKEGMRAFLTARRGRSLGSPKGIDDLAERTIVSDSERRRPGTRAGMTITHIFLTVSLVVAGLGPILWLAKAAITPTQDTLSQPFALWPNGMDWANLSTAWNDIHIDQYFFNTVVIAAGAWFSQLFIATTAGYALSVLRPKYAPILNALVLATLFIPGIVLLVPLYLTIVNPPLLGEVSLLNNYLAVWLPMAANAFNILLVKRFFDNLPREVFEAATTDGAGPFRLFWSIVLPMSKPILGVVSVFAIIAAWKDYLWPKLVLPNPAVQPLSVRLPDVQSQTELDVFLAALAISTLIPIAMFLLFQSVFLRSAGLGGAVKG